MTKPYSVQVADAEVPAADELPSPHFLRLLAAYANASNDEYDDALAAFQKVLALRPGHIPALDSIVLVLDRLDRPADAIAYSRQAIAIEPGVADHHKDLANALACLGRDDEAEAEYERALTLDPACSGAMWCKALFLLSRGRYSEAWPLFEQRWIVDRFRDQAFRAWATDARQRGKVSESLVALRFSVQIGQLRDALQGRDLAERINLFRAPLPVSFRRAKGLPRSTWGTVFAHAGLGVALIGIVCETTWNTEFIASMKRNDVAKVGGYSLTFDGTSERQQSNYREHIARFTVRENGQPIAVMTPSKRNFTTRAASTTEAALLTRGVSQLYISLGDIAADGSVAVRIYHKPMVLLIWFGPVLMAFGGVLSLSDRRLRVGAPKPAKAISILQPAE